MAAKHFIANAKNFRCKNCHFLLLISNDKEMMFTNAVIIQSDENGVVTAKCRECREVNPLPVKIEMKK